MGEVIDILKSKNAASETKTEWVLNFRRLLEACGEILSNLDEAGLTEEQLTFVLPKDMEPGFIAMLDDLENDEENEDLRIGLSALFGYYDDQKLTIDEILEMIGVKKITMEVVG